MSIISVKNVNKFFGDGVQVLKDVSFEVEQGEVLGIIGPSGSGKSTLLRSIAQLVKIDSGTITICSQQLVKDGVYADKKTQREIASLLGISRSYVSRIEKKALKKLKKELASK